MMRKVIKAGVSSVFVAGLLAAIFAQAIQSNSAEASIVSTDEFELYADFRFRYENDWDSKRSSGIERDDRERLRIRARIGFNYSPTDFLTLGVRIRTGAKDSHQSPHVTIADFDHNDRGDAAVNFDKWFVQAKFEDLSIWAGRNSIPFWKQNELVWDDDVTPVGVGLGYKWAVGEALNVTLNGGYFTLPVGMRDFAGNLAAAQLVLNTQVDDVKLTASAGVLVFDAETGDADAARLLSGNGGRDYTILVTSVKAEIPVAGRTLALAGDYIHNAKDYSPTDPDPVTAANHNETNGFVLSARYGAMKKLGEWQVGYSYARIERLAVNASYAQDDWMRWGSATETRAGDFKGHEIRFGVGLGHGMNILARFYTVESLTTVEDGKRFRLDFNVKF